ncbi:TetR family transcriptional regulator [Prauserella sp. PE36]|uniref:TetR/AcrR family transcriptional regulator n=1 Tax=Prauserella sp. PE36 TaxID=1504709 RepID=UPI000D83A59B|nr:TetR/AcrR family transcriptional regulator [Prauserella sp. PE36]PXY35019.1 TetR family transcriptional regulator [Prauserella coralliicola]RBM19186.1 TetR family transcriptional regulator [Prauserella sp. PE36]
MPPVKSRREMYSDATRAALLEQATALFAERGFAATSLEDVAAATQVTRGAVYHHFANKMALFEAVLDEQETRAMGEIASAAAGISDPLEAATKALGVFLDQCCEPVYGRLCWQEAPTALGFARWHEYEQKYAFGLVEGFVEALMSAGYLPRQAQETTTQFFFWMLGGAGMALSRTEPEDRRRVRDEWYELMIRSLSGLRP